MRIAHLILTDSFAGSERYAIDLANAQCAAHEVHVVLHRAATESRPDALRHRLDPRVKVSVLRAWKPWVPRAAARCLREIAPDIAHGHLSQGCKALRLLGPGITRRVATLHLRYKPQQHQGLDGLVAIAPWQLGEIPAGAVARVEQIDNWCAPFEPLSAEERTALRAKVRAALGLAPDTLLFGTLGRVESSKGHSVLLRAWEQAGLTPEQARLVIVGGGRDWAAVRRSAPPDVLMPGFAAQPLEWLLAMDVFVSAALSEPFGLVFLEAMQAGLPVLASDSEGASHLQRLFGSPLVPRGDVASLSDALAELARQRPGRRAYDLGAFERDAQVERIETFYRSLLAEGRQGP